MAKILIVEDNQGTNKAICEYMKEAGHTLFSAFTGSEALKIFRGEELDIIVLDIMNERSLCLSCGDRKAETSFKTVL